MPYKVAVASTDGKVVNEHFGRCKIYLVLSVDDEQDAYCFDRFQSIVPPCQNGEHQNQDFDLVLQALSDCRAVLTCKIGPVAEQYITVRGLQSLEYGGFIDDAVHKIIQYYKRVENPS